ncbi:MAG TPA: LysR family transcriptional regulator [Candidatus Binatia bacterium]|jgi:DNA-binding transcriptional LysR family regulator
MTPRNIRKTDLNLLIALNLLLEERNVTRAADRLGLTQSATSRMLGRLRAAFGDPLFVRTSRGLTPTKRALDIAGPLREYLLGLEKLLVEGDGFDPTTARRRFRIAAIDYVQATLLAPLIAKLHRQAPLIDFEIRQPSSDSEADLDSGVLDLLLMPQQPSAPGVVWTPLYRDAYTCLVWSRHPSRRLTLPAFAAMEHVLVAPRERAGGIVDSVLEKNGLTRRVAVQAPTFLLVPYLLIDTTRIATVPERMAGELVRSHALKTLQPPVEIPAFTMCQGWHEIHRNDPGHRWLRDQLIRASRE